MNVETKDDFKFSMGFGVLLGFCAFLIIWMLIRFFKRTKQRVLFNLRVVEQSLLEMQEMLEFAEREKNNEITDQKHDDDDDDVLLKSENETNKEEPTVENVETKKEI